MKKCLIVNINGRLAAKDGDGNLYEINGLVIPKPDKPAAFYDTTTSMFKAACCEGTTHGMEIQTNKLVNLY